MTDDLVKRLRELDTWVETAHTPIEAADRIEALEREVERRIEPEQVEKLIEVAEPIMAELYAAECAYRQEAEAKLAKAVEALRYYAGRTTYRLCDDCPVEVHSSADLSGPARDALAEIEGRSTRER